MQLKCEIKASNYSICWSNNASLRLTFPTNNCSQRVNGLRIPLSDFKEIELEIGLQDQLRKNVKI